LSDPVACIDVGPTSDYSVDGLPGTDSRVNFEDLMIFAMNYMQVSLGGPPPAVSAQEDSGQPPRLSLVLDRPDASGVVIAHLLLKNNASRVKGLHCVISHDAARMQLLSAQAGSLLSGAFFTRVADPAGTAVDAAALGEGAVISGDGEIAQLRFQSGSGALPPTIAGQDLRDAHNRFLADRPQGGSPAALAEQDPEPRAGQGAPVRLELLGARPNPFNGSTEIRFRLPAATRVSLHVYDLSGRLVRTLSDEVIAAGDHGLVWDGRNDEGRNVGIGVYMYTFRAGEYQEARKLYRFR
jgi:hypothetical protein